MSEIPEDIWKEVEKTFPYFLFTSGTLIEVVLKSSKQAMAQAIMAERKRCAEIASKYASEAWGITEEEHAATVIASAIMVGEK